MMRSGRIKSGLGSSLPALGPSQRAQTDHSELGWWMLHWPPHHFPPSSCEVSTTPQAKHTGVWDLIHTLTLHKDLMTAWELSRNVFCHIDSWEFLYIYNIQRETPAWELCSTDWTLRMASISVILSWRNHTYIISMLQKPCHALWEGLGVSGLPWKREKIQ